MHLIYANCFWKWLINRTCGGIRLPGEFLMGVNFMLPKFYFYKTHLTNQLFIRCLKHNEKEYVVPIKKY